MKSQVELAKSILESAGYKVEKKTDYINEESHAISFFDTKYSKMKNARTVSYAKDLHNKGTALLSKGASVESIAQETKPKLKELASTMEKEHKLANKAFDPYIKARNAKRDELLASGDYEKSGYDGWDGIDATNAAEKHPDVKSLRDEYIEHRNAYEEAAEELANTYRDTVMSALVATEQMKFVTTSYGQTKMKPLNPEYNLSTLIGTDKIKWNNYY